MISVITPIYRDENAIDLNKDIEQLLSNWEIEREGISECMVDLTFDHTERRLKTDEEITPTQHALLSVLREHQNVLETKIDELKDIIYSGYKETPLEKKEHRMNRQEMSEWLGKNVKPLILKGVTKREAVAMELECPGPSILWRIRSVYGKSMSWKKYVANVEDGVY